MTILDPQILAFAAVALLVTISPGPDTFLVIGNTLARGTRGGLATVLGIVTGGLFHAALMGLGLSQLLVHSESAFYAVKAVGAGYLFYLGARALLNVWRKPAADAPLGATRTPSVRACYAQGVLTNALNPKVAAFYLAFLPQFMQPGDPFAAKALLMVGIHYAMGLVWLSLVVLGVRRLSRQLAREGVRRWLDSVIGAVMMAFAVRLAVASR
ncbi:MAG TPA: LysE family translocator [Solimonas sp.]|nr:LysE family translocator [Solimonas sp.]